MAPQNDVNSLYQQQGRQIETIALEKHGRENFYREVLEYCNTKDELCIREKAWIQHFRWNKGKKLSSLTDQHRQKISNSLIGHQQTTSTKQAISANMKGKSKSDEHRLNLSLANTGKRLSEETKKKMSESRKGQKQQIVICPHCQKSGGTAMFRWHFDKCQSKITHVGLLEQRFH